MCTPLCLNLEICEVHLHLVTFSLIGHQQVSSTKVRFSLCVQAEEAGTLNRFRFLYQRSGGSTLPENLSSGSSVLPQKHTQLHSLCFASVVVVVVGLIGKRWDCLLFCLKSLLQRGERPSPDPEQRLLCFCRTETRTESE